MKLFTKRKEKKQKEKKFIGKMHVWALVDAISEEWKEVKDETIAELKKHIEQLKKDLEMLQGQYNTQTKAYNEHVFKTNTERVSLQSLIAQLQTQILLKEQTKEAG